MLPTTGWFLGISGKSFANRGPSKRARKFTTPPFSPIFITPNQSYSTPVKPKEISNAVFAVEKVESIIAGKTLVSPKKINLINAMTNAITKKAIQI